MPGRQKQKRINEARAMPNIIDAQDKNARHRLRDFFAREIILELGCGSGDYAVNLAEKYPRKKFIGVDIQGERLWLGAKQAAKAKLYNAIFLRAGVERLTEFIPLQSVAEIWLTFPDPYPGKKQAKKRLTGEKFLKIYATLLRPGGILHLKTDNKNLFDFSAESIVNFNGQIIACGDSDRLQKKYPNLAIRTYFENKHRAMGDAIYYLRTNLRITKIIDP